MGLDSRNTARVVTPTRMAAVVTLSQLIPEKLPRLQPWRFTISLSSAKVTTKSVMAEQIYPIMMPATSSVAMPLSLWDIIRMKPTERSEPTKAAIISVQLDTAPKAPI